MKKRQKPILLVTFLAILIALVVGINLMSNPDRSKPDPNMVSEEHKAADLTNVGKDAATKMGGKTPPLKQTGHVSGPMSHMPTRGILKAETAYKPQRPVPNDTSTSSQWYEKDAGGFKKSSK